MTWMNEYEIDDAVERFADHPVLGPATRTLSSLRDAVNASSDGWPYWTKPAHAAARLMALIEGDRSFDARYGEREDATPEQLRAAYRPLKAFRTRSRLDFPLFDPDTAADQAA